MNLKQQMITDEGHLGGYITNGDQKSFDPKLWLWLINKMQVRSLLDIGCGQGIMMDFFNRKDCLVFGIDGSKSAADNNLVPGHIILHDYITGPYKPAKSFDLVFSEEFVEHVEEKYSPNFLETFTASKKFLIITHALVGQTGWHHVNCKDDKYWIKKIEPLGFLYSPIMTKKIKTLSAGMNNYIYRSGLFFVKNTFEFKIDLLEKCSIVFKFYTQKCLYIIKRFLLIIDKIVGQIGIKIKSANPRIYSAIKNVLHKNF